jgi:hypothetical protein
LPVPLAFAARALGLAANLTVWHFFAENEFTALASALVTRGDTAEREDGPQPINRQQPICWAFSPVVNGTLA